MNQEYKEKLCRQVVKNFSDLEQRILMDVVYRIKRTGEITSTADWQINRLRVLGNSSEDIEKMIKEALDASYPEMFELYDKVIDWEYVRNKDVYEQINAEYIPFEENLQLQQLTNAIAQQTTEDLQNITQSLGFYLDYGQGRRVLTPLAEVYQGYLDMACLDIVSGAFDYNSVLSRVVTQLTNSGLRQIEYASGHANRVDVAARRAIMTGITQLTGHISDYNAQKLHTEYFEISWHAGARPTHQEWQGKVWSREQLVTVCGLGSVTGLEGVNCYHERYPFIPDLSERQWSDDWLRKKNAEENEPREYHGKKYTLYEAKQQQRKMETAMRAQREKVQLLYAGGADPDEVMLARAKYQGQLDEYARFSRKMGLPQERERIYIDTRGMIATNTERQNAKFHPGMIKNAAKDVLQYRKYKKVIGNAVGTLAEFGQAKYNDKEKWEYLNGLKEYLEKYPNSSKKYYDVQTVLRSEKLIKGIVLPPIQKQAFILPEGKYDPYHIMKRMAERNITDDEVRSYMKEADIMIIQWGGQRQAFYGRNGVSVITKSGDLWIFKTAWKNVDFDENTERILEVVEKYVKKQS